jgi:hypothetical protein
MFVNTNFVTLHPNDYELLGMFIYVQFPVRKVTHGDSLVRRKVLDHAFESLLVSRLDTVAVYVNAVWCTWFQDFLLDLKKKD